MDVLDEILASLRLSGGVVIDGEFSGDFCVHAEFTPNHCAPFFPLPERLIAYHYVRSGKMIIEVDGEAPVSLGPGSVAILPRNDPHLLARRSGLPAVDKAEILWITDEGIHRVSSGGAGEKAEVWCGFLGTSKSSEHPLLDALPPLLTLDVSGGEAQWLDSSMRFLAEQSQSPEMVARLAELFLAQAIREYVESLPPGSTGWLRGLADPAVSKALSIIHTRYAEDLDVEGLAREAGVSRTVLGERFVELLGEPPMRYCARWRMRVASNMLREGKHNTANIGYSVGFNSEAAFNRAFKREFGEPPVTWRRRVEAEEAARSVTSNASDAPRPPDTIGTCKGRDGSNIAFAVAGSGFPIFKAPNWMTHLGHDWTSPVYGPWYELACDMGQLVRMDLRGFGTSDREPREFTFDAMVEDMKAVADSAGIEKCDLIGVSHGGAFAIAFAGRYPERVRKLVLVNSFAAGWRVRADPEEIAWRESLLEMNRRQPSFRRSLLGEMFITLYFPSASDELIAWHNEHFATLGPVANMQPMIDLASMIDVREELPKIEAPTLVFHADKDGNAPISVGRQVADGIRGARFIELESSNHVLLGDEPAWEVFERETRAFLGDRPLPQQAVAPELRESIQTTQSRDGVRIAYAACGEGFPILKAPTAVTHLEHDHANPIYGHWIRELSRSNRLIRADMRGFGMSERDPDHFSMDAMVDDLAAVVEASGLERFDLIGLTHGAAIAIAYAARHPERVRKLVLLNSFPTGWAVRADPAEIALRKGLMELNRERWSSEDVIISERFMSLYFPAEASEIVDWHKGRLREFCTAEGVERMLEWGSRIDVRNELAGVRAETLMFHANRDGNAPIEVGREVANSISGARFVELNSANHVTLANEPAWPALVKELREFLSAQEVQVPPARVVNPA